MKTLLERIKTAIEAESTLSYVKAVYRGTILPALLQYPAICLDPEETSCVWIKENEIRKIRYFINIFCIVRTMKDEETSLIGNATLKGLLDLTNDMMDCLDGNLFPSGEINYLAKSFIESITYESAEYGDNVWLRVATIKFVGEGLPEEVD